MIQAFVASSSHHIVNQLLVYEVWKNWAHRLREAMTSCGPWSAIANQISALAKSS